MHNDFYWDKQLLKFITIYYKSQLNTLKNVIWKEYLFIAVDWICTRKSNYFCKYYDLISYTALLASYHGSTKITFDDFIVKVCVEYC